MCTRLDIYTLATMTGSIPTSVDELLVTERIIRLVVNPIGGVMVSVLALSALDRGFESRSGQIKLVFIKLVFVTSP
jgi:hypothetical protein